MLRPDLTKAYAFTYDLGVEPMICGIDRVYFRGGPVLVNDEEGSVVKFANGAADAMIVKN